MTLKPENVRYSELVVSLFDNDLEFRSFVGDCIKKQAKQGQQYGAYKTPEQYWEVASDGTDGSDGKGNYYTELRLNFSITPNRDVYLDVLFSEES